MKILKLRFKNLNSLVGEWEIDFTSSEYINEGIFAITGPTGSGKSTILDAICLAIYGQTPRLGKISSGQNEIMSRQTGECFAEVVFSTQKGEFRCHWSQKRARKVADGKLQTAEHEISDYKTGKVLESNIRKVAATIIEATGMDFEHFTRSMLLAQGGFAKFLQATPSERSTILEQITGSEIYGAVSVMVHKRKSSEEDKLKLIQAELCGTVILSAEQQDVLCQEQLKLEQEIKQINQQITLYTEHKQWLSGIDILDLELKQIEFGRQQLLIAQDQFAPLQLKLNNANKALNLEADYSNLHLQRKHYQQDLVTLTQIEALIPQQQQTLGAAEFGLNETQQQLTAARASQGSELKTITQVRSLDQSIAHKLSEVNRVSTELSKCETNLQATNKLIKDLNHNITLNQAQFKLKQKYVQDNSHDADLVSQLSGINAKLDSLSTLSIEQTKLQKELDANNLHCVESSKLESQLGRTKQNLDEQVNLIKQQILPLQQELEHTLNGEDLVSLNKQHKLLIEHSSQLSNILHLSQNLTRERTQWTKLNTQSNEVKQQISKIQPSLNKVAHQLELINQKINSQEQLIRLEIKIRDLEQQRHELNDGKPCPLCGALEHPYAEGNIPILSTTEYALEEYRVLLVQLQVQQNTLNANLSSKYGELEIYQQNIVEQTQLITDAEQQLRSQLTSLNLEYELANLEAEISNKLEQLGKNLEAVELRISAANKLNQQITVYELELNKIQNQSAEIEKQLIKLSGELIEFEKNNMRISKSLQQSLAEIEKLKLELDAILAKYQIAEFTDVKTPEIRQCLAEKLDKWLSNQVQYDSLSKLIEANVVNCKQQQALLTTHTASANELLGCRDKLKEELGSFQSERHILYADKNPDAEALKIQTQLQVLEESIVKYLAQHAQAKLDFEKSQARKLELLHSTTSQAEQLTSEQNLFLNKLNSAGFVDEDDFVLKRLSEVERNNLTLQADDLNNKAIRLSGQYQECETKLNAELAKQLTNLPLDELELLIKSAGTKHNQYLQNIGEINAQLNSNQQAQLRLAEAHLRLEKQQRETERWSLLHKLIGSADGKKFRNFAQGLTFEVMVAHANKQLQKISERYLLIRDKNEPLELNVVDNYQAGETRSTKNLSGGESFVVSLALALGLSKMSSNKVRVDSLFLDEGFGTLDEDALQTALDALANLHQEGKLIGVISHVNGLKERISLQINVEPQSGGISKFSGIGCRKIA